MSDEKLEPIIGVAIRHKGLVIALPKPARHQDVIRHATQLLGLTPPICGAQDMQGFYTASGEYLSRKQAMHRADVTEQCINPSYPAHGLFSEDLW